VQLDTLFTEKVFTGQGVHAAVLLFQYDPEVHDTQPVASMPEKVLGLHGVHALAPVFFEYVSGGHGLGHALVDVPPA
jgi:hypothetical protein